MGQERPLASYTQTFSTVHVTHTHWLLYNLQKLQFFLSAFFSSSFSLVFILTCNSQTIVALRNTVKLKPFAELSLLGEPDTGGDSHTVRTYICVICHFIYICILHLLWMEQCSQVQILIVTKLVTEASWKMLVSLHTCIQWKSVHMMLILNPSTQ